MQRYLTDRKRASGLGSAQTGTEQFWQQSVLGTALLVLTPLFLFMVGGQLGNPHQEVVTYFSQPFPAIVSALMFVVGFIHYKNGARVLIEDYVQGLARKVWIIVVNCISYAAIAAALYALALLILQ